MDSGSGSMQSSSGGDDEYDSRAESISALLSNPPSQLGHMSSHAPPHHHHHHHQQTHHHLDPLSNMFDPLSSRLTNPNPLLNFDMAWSKTLRSDPNPTDLGGLSQPFLTNPNINQLGQSRGGGGGGGGSSTFAALQIPHDHQNVSASSSAPNNQTHNINSNSNNNNSNSNGVVRNPKKRSRASRRAPTTVLTTDTTNFRAMVQEFTGIPAPPFTSSSPFPRSRLDLFSSAAAASALMRSAGGGGGGGGGGLGLEPSPPSYLLRPFAHKVSHQPPSSSSILDHPNLPSTNSSATNHHNNLLNMQQNPSPSSSSVLNFQSLFQPQHQQQQPKYSLPINSPNDLLASKTPHHHHHQGSLDHFGLTQQQLNVLPNNIVSSSDAALSRHDSNSNWGNGTGPSNNNKTNIDNNNVDHQGLMRSINGNYGNGKLNYSAGSSSNNIIHGDKAQDQNVAAAAARSEEEEEEEERRKIYQMV
ncbi:PREDICTED: VQ [Prunus dulcis]|uniref:PREDICTED: VQ n=1 Tax=Prunus dulcis TaxID=3755 RepID=A0A5E4GBA8_PRUDU|nr:PREDICTED: VQ [Prunus dulcis]